MVRRVARVVVAAFLILTLASLSFNGLTNPRQTYAAPSGRDVRVGSLRVHYEQWGTQGTPLVLVGGFAESTVAWSLVAPILARNHAVYAVDLAGYGYTEYDGHYTLPDQTGLVAGFMRALALDRPVLVGHSLGAAVVGSVALTAPGLIGGVVFADGDALPFGNGSGRAGPPSLLLRLPYLTSLYRIGTHWSWLDEQIVRAQCGSVCRGFSPALVDAWLRPLRQGAAQDALVTMASAPMLHLTPAQIRSISVPTGIVWGAQDSRSGGSLASAKADLHDPPTVVIPGAAHLSMVADPAAFAAAVETVIRHP